VNQRSFHRDARARAFQSMAMLLVLVVVLALLLHTLVYRDTTQTSARIPGTTVQPSTGRF
jgi:competence protein ComGC